MAWTKTTWACGHEGSMQLYGKRAGRESQVAFEVGRQCMACWLVEQWETKNDPGAKREDRYTARRRRRNQDRKFDGESRARAGTRPGKRVLSLRRRIAAAYLRRRRVVRGEHRTYRPAGRRIRDDRRDANQRFSAAAGRDDRLFGARSGHDDWSREAD